MTLIELLLDALPPRPHEPAARAEHVEVRAAIEAYDDLELRSLWRAHPDDVYTCAVGLAWVSAALDAGRCVSHPAYGLLRRLVERCDPPVRAVAGYQLTMFAASIEEVEVALDAFSTAEAEWPQLKPRVQLVVAPYRVDASEAVRFAVGGPPAR